LKHKKKIFYIVYQNLNDNSYLKVIYPTHLHKKHAQSIKMERIMDCVMTRNVKQTANFSETQKIFRIVFIVDSKKKKITDVKIYIVSLFV